MTMKYCLTINSDIEYKTIKNYTVNVDENSQKSKKLFATFDLKGKSVKFELDSGATCNVNPVDVLPISKRNLKSTRQLLKMYNNGIVKPLGRCKMSLKNQSNKIYYYIIIYL